MTEICYIGVGSNIEPENMLPQALAILADKEHVTKTSTVYRTKALGDRNQPDYLNAVWQIETEIDPHTLKHTILQAIEKTLGRVRCSDKYASRPIDLDILLFGSRVIDSNDMRIPDPDIYTRPFIAVPLFEIAPSLILPGTGDMIENIARKMDRNEMTAEGDTTKILRRMI